jgi:hypothetical protein
MRTKWRVTTDDCVLCLSRTRQSMSFVLYGNFDPATRKVVYNIVCNKVYHYLYVDDRRYLFSLSLCWVMHATRTCNIQASDAV